MKSQKLPAFQLYVGDWKKDPGVSALDLEGKGFWFEILLLMHESSERGVLLLNGKPFPVEALARLLNLDNQKATKLLNLLVDYGVADRREDGALVCRRMVKDESIRLKRIKCGSMGGNPNLVNQNSTKSKKVGKPLNNQNTEYEYEDEYEDQINKKEVEPPKPPTDERPWPPPVDNSDQNAVFLKDAYAQFAPNSEICITSGRKPMKNYPEIWITPHELAEVFRIYDGVIPKSEFRRVFQKVKFWATSKIAEGADPKRLHTPGALMGWALKEVVGELNEQAKLKKNSEVRA